MKSKSELEKEIKLLKKRLASIKSEIKKLAEKGTESIALKECYIRDVAELRILEWVIK